VGHAKQTNGEPPPEWALAKSFLEEVFGHQNVWVESFPQKKKNLFLEETPVTQWISGTRKEQVL